MAAAPSSEHHEFEQLAVQHVLGGLPVEASSRFRDHLVGCRACRQRVVELRGIASDLESAARQERRLARDTQLETVPVETARRERTDGDEPPRHRLDAVRNVVAVAALVAVTIFAFWNVHLQSVRAALEASLEERGEVLDVFAEGELVEAEVRITGMQAQVAVLGRTVAVNASGVPQVMEDRRVVLWSRDVDVVHTPLAFVAGAGVPDGRLVMHVERVAGPDVVVTLEPFPFAEQPRGTVMLRATIR